LQVYACIIMPTKLLITSIFLIAPARRCWELGIEMDHHHPQQQQQYGDPYRGLMTSPQSDHHLHALQYHQPQPQQQPALMSPPQPQPALMSPQPQQTLMSPPQPQQHHHASLASHFHLLHVSNGVFGVVWSFVFWGPLLLV
jgi:hypothetical protein